MEAQGIIENKFWHAAANRMYYTCYYMVTALLLKNGHSSHTHGGTIGLFGLHFIKTGIVSSELVKFYSQLYELRQTGDYDDWKVVTEVDVMPLVPIVETFPFFRICNSEGKNINIFNARTNAVAVLRQPYNPNGVVVGLSH